MQLRICDATTRISEKTTVKWSNWLTGWKNLFQIIRIFTSQHSKSHSCRAFLFHFEILLMSYPSILSFTDQLEKLFHVCILLIERALINQKINSKSIHVPIHVQEQMTKHHRSCLHLLFCSRWMVWKAVKIEQAFFLVLI